MIKLKRFNKQHKVKSMYSKDALLSITLVNGSIRLNMTAANWLGVTHGDRVELLQDTEKPKNWYIHKSDVGFELKPKSNDPHGFYIRNVYGVMRMLLSIDSNGLQDNKRQLKKKLGKPKEYAAGNAELDGVPTSQKIKIFPIIW